MASSQSIRPVLMYCKSLRRTGRLDRGAWTNGSREASAGKCVARPRCLQNEYTLSKRSINDLLSVEQDVWSATSAKIMAEYDGWSAAINYASAVDNLLPLIGIEKNAAAKLPDLS